MMSRVALAVLACVLAATPAHADARLKPDAQAHLDAALKAYGAKDYDTAIREFGVAYGIDPNPNLLYATAQAYRFANRCAEAIELYKRYLAAKQAASCAPAERTTCEAQITAARNGISLCEAVVKQATPPPPEPVPEKPPAPAPTPAAPPPVVAAPPTATIVATVPRESPWYKDPLGDGLTAGGVVGVGVGIGFLVMASSSESAAHTATLRNDFVHDLDQATLDRRVGAVALVAGAALVAGGVVVYLRHARVATDGHSIAIAGSF
jgi:hypothetical protein